MGFANKQNIREYKVKQGIIGSLLQKINFAFTFNDQLHHFSEFLFTILNSVNQRDINRLFHLYIEVILNLKMKIAFFIVLTSIVLGAKKLLLLQQLFRHGARYPQIVLNKDNSKIAQQRKSIGELTVYGKNMHYLLGKQLKSIYWPLLFNGTQYEDTYNQSKIYVKSTNYNRTIQSAQSQLMGWFQSLKPLTLPSSRFNYSLPPWPNMQFKPPNTENLVIFQEKGQSYHPVPVHVEKVGANLYDEGDFLSSYFFESCPNQAFWQTENMMTAQAQKYKQIPQVKQALQALSKEVNITVPYEQAYPYIQNGICLEYLDVPYLSIFKQKKYDEVFNFIMSSYMYLSLYHTKVQKQIANSGFFKATIDNMDKVLNNIENPQLILYSAHDTNIGAVLAATQLASSQCIYDNFVKKMKNQDTCIVNYPQFAANIIFELWKDDNSQPYIRLLYNGIPRKLPWCSYKLECPYNQFKDWINNFISNSVLRDCGIVNPSNRLYPLIVILLGVAILLLVLYIYEKRKNKKLTKPEKYYPHVEEKEVKQFEVAE